jgi:hypothetical protein
MKSEVPDAIREGMACFARPRAAVPLPAFARCASARQAARREIVRISRPVAIAASSTRFRRLQSWHAPSRAVPRPRITRTELAAQIDATDFQLRRVDLRSTLLRPALAVLRRSSGPRPGSLATVNSMAGLHRKPQCRVLQLRYASMRPASSQERADASNWTRTIRQLMENAIYQFLRVTHAASISRSEAFEPCRQRSHENARRLGGHARLERVRIEAGCSKR